jgi:hypothetical protein
MPESKFDWAVPARDAWSQLGRKMGQLALSLVFWMMASLKPSRSVMGASLPFAAAVGNGKDSPTFGSSRALAMERSLSLEGYVNGGAGYG